VARFTRNCSGLTCSFDASASADDNGIVSYQWDLGKLPDRYATGVVVTTMYPHTSTRTVVLTVTDASGQTSSATQTFDVSESQPPPPPPAEPPVARFTVSCAALTCTFDASTSTAGSGIASYDWDLGKFPDRYATGVVVTATYPHASTRTVTLTVTDNLGQTSTATQTFDVAAASASARTP
jgi:uncharacterized protein YcnI